jgi:hypothetical protein
LIRIIRMEYVQAVLPLNIHPTPGIGEALRRSLRLCWPCNELVAVRITVRQERTARHSLDNENPRFR